MNSDIILIGMPGCGKSTCGVLAAKARCMSFLDTDLLIQEHEGAKLQEIIQSHGTDYFAKVEEEILSNVSVRNSIIATGGSAIYYDRAMKHLKGIGTVVYLRISLSEMLSRIKNIKTRGILLKPGETIEEMYRHRVSLYERYADVTIDCDSTDIETIVEKICDIHN